MAIKLDIEEKNSYHIVNGPLWRAIWHLTWPILISMCAFAIGTFVDTWVAGRLSTDAQAAMGIGWQIRYFMMTLTMALEVGATALVSRYHGAGDKINAIQAARQSLIWGSIFGIVSVAVGLPTCRLLLKLLGASINVVDQGWEYLKFGLVANIPATLLWTTQSIHRSVGNTKVSMFANIMVTIIITLFDLVFCIYPLKLGIGGIGLSWIIATSIVFIWNIIQLGKSEIGECLKIAVSFDWRVSYQWFLRIMTIGLPGCIQEIALIVGSFGLFSILAHTNNPAVSQAAWGIGWRLEELAVFSPLFALNVAIAIIVGQNLGAKQTERAVQATWQMVWAGIILNTIMAVILYLFASPIAHIMSNDAEIAKATMDYFYWIAWTEPFSAWCIFSGAMQGAAYTKWPMIITVFSFFIARLSLAWYLTVVIGMGANGTWLAMALTSVMATILMALIFNFGKWKHQTV